MKIYPCANTKCDNLVEDCGDYCQTCQTAIQEQAKREKKTRWQWAGWTRQEESQHHQKGAK